MTAVPPPRASQVGGAQHEPQGRIETAEDYTSDPALFPLYRSLLAAQEALNHRDAPSPSASQQSAGPAPAVITPEYLGEAFALALRVLAIM